MEEKCLAKEKRAQLKNAWHCGKKYSALPGNAWNSRKVLSREETQPGRAAMCILSEVLYLWATVRFFKPCSLRVVC